MKVIPKSSRNGVVGWMGEVLKVCVTAPPERGKANEAVEAVLAEALGLPRGQVRVAAGPTSPRKVIEIEGLDPAEVRRRLSTWVEEKSS
ncbi:MAG TPA: DUF167 domain-containing protein [Candidatus Manganitrophaceae bacterium]|nr:DUF167 domain-containing protein [Candidatus Manganitrophaceae bacterium]